MTTRKRKAGSTPKKGRPMSGGVIRKIRKSMAQGGSVASIIALVLMLIWRSDSFASTPLIPEDLRGGVMYPVTRAGDLVLDNRQSQLCLRILADAVEKTPIGEAELELVNSCSSHLLAIEANPRTKAIILTVRGAFNLLANQFSVAIADLEEAQSLDPGYFWAFHLAAIAYSKALELLPAEVDPHAADEEDLRQLVEEIFGLVQKKKEADDKWKEMEQGTRNAAATRVFIFSQSRERQGLVLLAATTDLRSPMDGRGGILIGCPGGYTIFDSNPTLPSVVREPGVVASPGQNGPNPRVLSRSEYPTVDEERCSSTDISSGLVRYTAGTDGGFLDGGFVTAGGCDACGHGRYGGRLASVSAVIEQGPFEKGKNWICGRHLCSRSLNDCTDIALLPVGEEDLHFVGWSGIWDESGRSCTATFDLEPHTASNSGKGGLSVTDSGNGTLSMSCGDGALKVADCGNGTLSVTNSGNGALTAICGDGALSMGCGDGTLTVANSGDGRLSVTDSGNGTLSMGCGDGALTVANSGDGRLSVTDSGNGALRVTCGTDALTVAICGNGALTMDLCNTCDHDTSSATGGQGSPGGRVGTTERLIEAYLASVVPRLVEGLGLPFENSGSDGDESYGGGNCGPHGWDDEISRWIAFRHFTDSREAAEWRPDRER